jgi:hypothetical protein
LRNYVPVGGQTSEAAVSRCLPSALCAWFQRGWRLNPFWI